MDKATTGFRVPDKVDRQNAIGSLAGTPIRIKKAITAISNSFEPMDAPKESDWLWDHEEYGQPYEIYKSSNDYRQFNAQDRNTIYIQPLEANIGFTTELKKFCLAFFKGCQVKVRPAVVIEDVPAVQRRVNEYTNQQQLNARDINTYLRGILPRDAICMIGITRVDLYPQDEWNFVFGIGSLIHGVGVFSFARYMHETDDMLSNELVDRDTLVYRACKIMVHEISHMFGLRHCIYFKCLMNGQNHQEENYRTPLEMCVVCLRKLQHNIGFPFIDRYQDLIDFCKGRQAFEEKDVAIYENLKSLVVNAYGPHYK